MLGIKFEIEGEYDESLGNGNPPPPPDSATELLDALTEWWVRNIADPYTYLKASEKLDPIAIQWNFIGEKTSFEVALLPLAGVHYRL